MNLGLLFVLQLKQKLSPMGTLNLGAEDNLCGGFFQRPAAVSGNGLTAGQAACFIHLLLHRYVSVH